MSMKIIAGIAMLTASVSLAVAQETPFGEPSTNYMKQFAKPNEKVFVYERYGADGSLYQRDITPMQSQVEVTSATTRKINGVEYRLRGLTACPEQRVDYLNEKWDCQDAVKDAESSIYARAKVVLCKTLKLKSESGNPDPVSCFSLVGDGTSNDPYGVSYDDDDLVFLGLAGIAKNDKGEPLRPDLENSQRLGATLGMQDDR